MSNVFETHVQPRFRDLNPGNHVDSVECLRLMDEARLVFFRHTSLPINAPGERGLFAFLPAEATHVIASHHINYLDELRYTGPEPHLVEIVVSRVGGSSFEVSCRLFAHGATTPSMICVSTTVFRDRETGGPWKIEGPFAEALEHYRGQRAPMR